jgi:hypothetical protein
VAGELLSNSHAVPGLGDGGTHIGSICDPSFPTTLLSYWGRDRSWGVRFPPDWIIARPCPATAGAVDLLDRGILAPGHKADINVIDFENLGLTRPLAFDLPTGGKRFLQSSGYLLTFVSGVNVATDGEPTGELPGATGVGASGSHPRGSGVTATHERCGGLASFQLGRHWRYDVLRQHAALRIATVGGQVACCKRAAGERRLTPLLARQTSAVGPWSPILRRRRGRSAGTPRCARRRAANTRARPVPCFARKL